MQLQILRKQQLKYLNGDRELKEAITNISHDLRTPLTAICGYMDLLESVCQEKKEKVRYILLIKNRIEALKHLTEELFQYSIILSTQEDMELEHVSINQILEESIIEFYGALTERGITPEIKMPTQNIYRQLNKAALSRVFGNILNNALKYSERDLSIELKDTGEIIFSNTASAINEVQVGKLFDRFFTVEAARNSTGLGLSIAKTLIEQMGGTISAQIITGKLCIILKFEQ